MVKTGKMDNYWTNTGSQSKSFWCIAATSMGQILVKIQNDNVFGKA